MGYAIQHAISTSKVDRKGIAWCFLIDYEMDKIPRIKKRNLYEPVICLETGQQFATQKEAEKAFGFSSGSISRALSKCRPVKGYHFVTASEYSDKKDVEIRATEREYKVICLETGGRYKTYVDAAKELGISDQNVSNAVKAESHYARGYHFMSCTEYDSLSEQDIQNVLKKGKSREVACVETGKIYQSAAAASETYPESRKRTAYRRIRLCCRDPYKTYDGKHWCYTNDLHQRKANAASYSIALKTPVRCVETGREYESLADAARDTGINANSIRLVSKGERRKAGGFTWEYIGVTSAKKGRQGAVQPSSKKVRCVELGKIFASLNIAAKTIGLCNGNSIGRAIKKYGTAGGYHWEYVDDTDNHCSENQQVDGSL